MKRLSGIAVILVCAVLASIYIYPVFSGLIILPLDLLVSNSSPWHMAGTILLKNPYMQDSILQMFPWKHLTFASLTSGIVPLWNPYQFLGMPFMAAMKPLVFYPANLLFIFGEATAWNGLLWLQLFLSLWFMVLFIESCGLGVGFGIFAGISFAFSSLMVSVLEFGSEGHVLLWLPVLLYFVKKYIDTNKPGFMIGLSLATATSILAGQLQYFAYISVMIVAFSWFYGKTFRPIIGLILGGFIAGVQLIPGFEMFRTSYRGLTDGYSVFSNGLLKPYHMLKFLSPDWFGNPVSLDLRGGYIEVAGYFGIIPLFFALYAIVYQMKNRFVRFLGVAAGIALLFSMDGIAQLLYILRIPVVTSGYGGRMFSMVLFSGAALSAFGMDAFVREPQKARKIRALAGFTLLATFCFAGGLLIARASPTIGVRFANIKIQAAALFAFLIAAFLYVRYGHRNRLLTILFVVVTVILTFGDLFRMGYRFLTFSNPKFLYPATEITKFVRRETDPTLGRVYGVTEPEINTALGVYGVETYNPLLPIRTVNLLRALENRKGSESLNNKYYLTRNPQMKYALDFLGVSLIVVPKGENPAISLWNSSAFEKDITKVFGDEVSDVYQNRNALPRFGLYWDIRQDTSDDSALKAIGTRAVDFTKTVLIKEHVREQMTPGTGSAELREAGINSLSFTVETNSPAVFYLSDSYDSGWHASVNGQETPILHANYNFRGIVVPSGTSTVRFWYLPVSFIIGSVISVTGIIALVLYGALAGKVNNRQTQGQNAHKNTGLE